MPHYMISFNDGDMNFPAENFEQVGRDAHAVMREAQAQGVWVFGGGFRGDQRSVVDAQGTVSAGPLAASPVHLGGFCILRVESRTEAEHWAREFAQACRCPQEIREFMDDPEQFQ